MAVTLGDHAAYAFAGSTGSRTITPAAGSAIVAVWTGNSQRTVSFSDDKGGSYTAENISDLGSFDIAIGYALNVAGGSTVVSFDNGGASTDFCFWAFELTNVKTTGAGDGTNSNSNLSDTTPIGGSVTTTGAGVVIGVLNLGGNGVTIAPDCADASPTTGWTTVDEFESAANGTGGSVIYQAFAAASTRNPGWTIGTGNNTYGMTLALLEATGAPSPQVFTFPRWGSIRR